MPRKKTKMAMALSVRDLVSSSSSNAQEGDEEKIALVEEQDRRPDRLNCMSLIKTGCIRRGEKLSDLYGRWRHEQRSQAAKMERHLNARWMLDEMIEQELSRFRSHYHQAMGPSRLREVADMLMPKWKTPLENAALGWLGDWRPSSILGLLQSFCRSRFLSLSPQADQLLLELLTTSRNEEAVLDEEMAEYQATFVLKLQFGGRYSFPFEGGEYKKNSVGVMLSVQSALKKINDVISRAQHQRYKAVEAVVTKLLDRAQAATFLVAFAGIQDIMHSLTVERKLQMSPLCLPVPDLR